MPRCLLPLLHSCIPRLWHTSEDTKIAKILEQCTHASQCSFNTPVLLGLHTLQRMPPVTLLCALLIRLMLKHQGGKHASFPGPKCNQLMRFESLALLLPHADAASHLAEVWSGETRDPYKVRQPASQCKSGTFSELPLQSMFTTQT